MTDRTRYILDALAFASGCALVVTGISVAAGMPVHDAASDVLIACGTAIVALAIASRS